MRKLSPLGTALFLALSACDHTAPPVPASKVAPSQGAAPAAQPKAATSAVKAGTSAPDGSGAGATPPAGPALSRPAKPLNVLVITVDSLRADMPWTGYERPIAPNLAKLAEKSVVYTKAYSGSSYTAKSVATLLSGRHASTLYRSGWFFANYAKANDFFTETLQAKGVRTIGGHAHMYFGRGKGLEQGFDVWELVPGITFDPNTDNHVTSDKMTVMIQELLGKPENTSKQFFAWFHYMDPHDVYVQHDDTPVWGKKNRDRYDSEVHFTDQHLGKLFAWLERQPWWSNTALIVSADHGEAFGENSAHKHAFDLWEVLTRVPLIVHLPGVAPRRIDERRSAVDLAPTIMDLMGQEPLPSFQGSTLVPELYGGPLVKRDHVMTELAEDSHNPQVRSVIRGDWKLTVYGKGWKYSLYDLAADPGEKTDLAKKDPAKLAEMQAYYQQVIDKLPIIDAYGGMKLKGGGEAKGPMGPAK